LGDGTGMSVVTISEGQSTTTTTAGECIYTLTIPGTADPVITWTGGSSDYEPIDTQFTIGLENSYSQWCWTYDELGNYAGWAFAKIEYTTNLGSSYCNTDSTDLWSFAQATNGSYQNGNIAPSTSGGTPSFNTWYQSSLSGSIYYGTFWLCMENPANGQETYYDCWYGYEGPFF
jgi:hypothetical protein